jgi:hypothetical protein
MDIYQITVQVNVGLFLFYESAKVVHATKNELEILFLGSN